MGTRSGGLQGGATWLRGRGQSLAYAAKRTGRTPAERDAYAKMAVKAPPRAPPFERRWSVWGAGYGGTPITDGNATVGSSRHALAHLRRRGRPRLSPRSEHAGRLLARRRRHELQSRQRPRRRPLGDVPGRHLRPPLFRPGLYRRRTGLWLAGRHDRPRRAAEQLSRQLRCERDLRTARGRLSLRASAPAASRRMPRASSPPSCCRTMPSRSSPA